jgi:SAM-dependent methyltransferase
MSSPPQTAAKTVPATAVSPTGKAGKWPKILPPLTPELKRINDDFMEYWHDVLPKRFSVADRFNHEYVLRHCPNEFHRTLEIGCGLGEHLLYEKLTPEQERNYVGLDARENMVRRIEQRFPKVQTYLGDCQARLNFADGYFDRIIAINVLEHLPDLPRAVDEMHRLCDKKTGFLSVIIPCEGGLAYGIARRISAQRIYEKRYKIPYVNFIGREHINVPSEIYEELDRRFEIVSRTFFPFAFLPMEFCNLFIGLTLRPIT